MTHAEIIDLWPTVAQLARDLGVERARAYKWRERNNIPPEFWLPMCQFRDDLSLEDFAKGMAA